MLPSRALLPLVILCLFLIAPAGAQDDDVLSEIPTHYHEGVTQAFLAENDAALRASFAKLSPGDERVSWGFLVANLPVKVRDKIKEEALTENIRYAWKSRRELPWASEIPMDIFRHYVLPIVSGDEKAEAWRKQFFDELVPLLTKKRVADLAKAALAVNRWCAKKLRLKERWSRGSAPLQSLKRGYGNSLDAAIFFGAAARSVGIPTRVVTTPIWTFKTGGDSWSEVWTGKEWAFLGACEPVKKMGQVSFAKDLPRVALALARTLGVPKSEKVFSRRKTQTFIDVTARYAKTCRTTIEVKGADGKPVAGADVCMYIFSEEKNNAYMRPAFTAKADGRGRFEFDLGPGDYLFHASAGLAAGWRAVRAVPGKKATVAIAMFEEPAKGSRVSYRKTGRSALRIFLGAGALPATRPGSSRPSRPTRGIRSVSSGAVGRSSTSIPESTRSRHRGVEAKRRSSAR